VENGMQNISQIFTLLAPNNLLVNKQRVDEISELLFTVPPDGRLLHLTTVSFCTAGKTNLRLEKEKPRAGKV
jgi:hypothetical protein